MRIGSLVVLALSTLILVQDAAGQPATPTFVRVPEYIDLLKRPAVREDLEIIPPQAEELQKLFTARSANLTTSMVELRRLEGKEGRSVVYQKMQEELQDFERKAYELLLPFQRKRLDQIVNQVTIRASDATAGLTHKRMVDALQLTEKELQDIRAKSAEVGAKVRERLEELRKEMKAARDSARNEVLGLLSDEQRKLYHELNGELVDFDQSGQPIQQVIPPSNPPPK